MSEEVNKDSKLLSGLNKEQIAAVLHRGNPLLIVAGAGSGKTTVLVRKIAYLIGKGFALPYQILAITFTNKASKQMQDRVANLLGEEATNMWTLTFHSMCARILRYHIGELAVRKNYGLNSNFTIYDMSDSLRLISLVSQDLNVDSNKYSARNIATQISNWKNELLSPTEIKLETKDEFLSTALQIYTEYQKRLISNNACDFDDLIMYTVELFTVAPEILGLYQRRFKYLLVDEYQDTNHAQYQLVYLLTAAGDYEPKPELTVVGDADQSIYAFRGATIRNIEEFERDFPKAETIVLEQNYRSTQAILDAANSLISNNPNRIKKNLWSSLGEGEKVIAFSAENEYMEAEQVVSRIEEYLAADSKHTLDDVAITYRTNNVARAFEDALVRHGLPYKVIGGQKFYERKEIKDLLAYLKLINNVNDDISFLRIINSPKRGIGDKAVNTVREIAAQENSSLFAALKLIVVGKAKVSARLQKTLTEFYELILSLQANLAELHTAADLADFIKLVIETSGYKEFLQESLNFTDNSRLENMYELVSTANNFQDTVDYTDPFNSYITPKTSILDKFLEQISLSSDSDKLPDTGNGVITCMTLHTAKGLEYPLVFLVGLSEGLFPHFRAFGNEQELFEERRLAYVGITRAKNKLFLSYAQLRNNFGKTTPVLPSRFFQEISAELLAENLVGGSFIPEYTGSEWQGIPLETTKSNFPGKRISDRSKPKQQTIIWQVNDRVNHDKYGLGTIVEKNGEGITETVTIDFGSSGTMKLMTWGSVPMEKL